MPVSNVIRLDGRPTDGLNGPTETPATLTALRLITGMQPDEFADALAKELGCPIPLFVYLQWEQRGVEPPPYVRAGARTVSSRCLIGARGSTRSSRRHFLGGLVGLSTLTMTGFSLGTEPTARLVDVGGRGAAWRASPETAADLTTLAASYRRAYAGKAAVDQLLPSATGLMHLLMDMGTRDQWPGPRADLASLVGQMALLTGLLHLMGPRDLPGARTLYDLALRAATEAEDWDLAAYVLGSLAFEATTAGRHSDARAIRDAAWDLARRRAAPRTRAWAAALSSELFARDGDEAASGRALDDGFAAIGQTRDDPSWKGVGWFDETRLIAYEGGNLVLLGEYASAVGALRTSLSQLAPDRLKHRCTLSTDLATALVKQGEVEESCALAHDALSLARAISHRESVDRVRRVHFQLLRWRTHPSVRELTDRLDAA
jgi:hypothetical protein